MVRRRVARLRRRARAAGLELGVLRYRSEPWTAEAWAHGYGSGQLDYFAGIDELPRYSLLLGYLGFLGGEPEVLDVGCGPGLLRRRMGGLPVARYVGIDPTPAAIEAAADLADDRTAFVVGDVTDPALDLGRFDVVVCNEVLSVAEDPAAVLDRVAALLRPGGHVLTSTWRHPGDDALVRLLDDRFRPVDVAYAQNPANPIARRGWRVTCHRRDRADPDLTDHRGA